MDKLLKLINGRLVCMLLHGKSIETLKKQIPKLENYDICYVSLNYFEIMEKEILSEINEHLSIVYCSSEKAFRNNFRAIEKFLNRDEKNMLITTLQCLMEVEVEYLFNKFSDKIYFAKTHKYTGGIDTNSLANFLYAIIPLGVPYVFLFGADGLREVRANNIEAISDTYFGKKELLKRDRDWNLIMDTKNFNNYFMDNLWTLVEEERTRKYQQIINCSPRTFFVPHRGNGFFQTINYKDLQTCLQQTT